MSTLRKPALISVEEYLAGEPHSRVKHEYVNGQVRAMTGTSTAHNRISINLTLALDHHLRGSPCRVFMADVKVHVAHAFYYPDVMVACEPDDRHTYYREHPKLLIEVLSDSTRDTDLLEKLAAYQSIPALQEYAVFEQDRAEARVYRRAAGGWEVESFGAGENLRLASVGLEIPLADAYDRAWE